MNYWLSNCSIIRLISLAITENGRPSTLIPHPISDGKVEWVGALPFGPKTRHRFTAHIDILPLTLTRPGLSPVDLSTSERITLLIESEFLSWIPKRLDLFGRSYSPTAPCIGHCCIQSRSAWCHCCSWPIQPPKRNISGQHEPHISIWVSGTGFSNPVCTCQRWADLG